MASMAAKASARVRKKPVIKIIPSPLFKSIVKAQMASAAPPLGRILASRGINVANFCRDFNRATSHITPGVPLPLRVTVKPDRSYDLEICTPTSLWLIKHAAGIRRGSSNKTHEIAGKISVKHIYEIAKIKAQDKCLKGVPLQEICQRLVSTALSMGVEVQLNDLDPVEYQKFLEQRKQIVDEQLKKIEEEKAAKVLRTAGT